MKKKTYRSVTLRLNPTKKQEKFIDSQLIKVSKFLDISKTQFQKIVWHNAKKDTDLKEEHTRLLDLLAQRFSKTVMSNVLYPVDNRNYRFVENPCWMIEIRFQPKQKTKIAICRTENKYYKDILDGTAYPGFIYKEGANYFLSVSIPTTKKWRENAPLIVCGIDLNQRKHVASFYNTKTKKYEKNVFWDLRDTDKKIKKIQKEISKIQKGKKSTELSNEEKEKINKLYELIRKVIQKSQGDFVSRLLEIADDYYDKNNNVVFALEDLKGINKIARKSFKSFNRWLSSQWCYKKFGIILEAKPYFVEYVNPKYTSQKCHKCGSEVKIYGKHKRLIACENCEYRDFSRDLNASRNIVKLFMKQ